MTEINTKQELDIPFSKIDEWEAKLKSGVCAAFWEAANWGYQKGLSESASGKDFSND
jgi:hypothetical protein